jgi:hypothetical protein
MALATDDAIDLIMMRKVYLFEFTHGNVIDRVVTRMWWHIPNILAGYEWPIPDPGDVYDIVRDESLGEFNITDELKFIVMAEYDDSISFQ